MPKSTSSASFIFVGDTHVGNNYGICSPHPNMGDENDPNRVYDANPLQLKLYEGLKLCIDRIRQKRKIRAIFFTGDLVDGPNLKKSGKDTWTYDPIVAAFDFNKLLWPLASTAEEVFVIRGSDYHVSPDRTVINYDEMAAQMIGAKSYTTKLHGERVDGAALARKVKALNDQGVKDTDINLKQIKEDLRKEQTHLAKKLGVGDNLFKKAQESLLSSKGVQQANGPVPYPLSGVRFKGIYHGTVGIVVKHNVSYSPNYMYRSTGLIRNDMIQTLQKERHFPNGYNSIIYGYGHVHYFHQSGNATHYNFTTPAMKKNDSYLAQYGIAEPDLGIVENIVEPNDEVIVKGYTLTGDDYPVEEPYKL